MEERVMESVYLEAKPWRFNEKKAPGQGEISLFTIS